MISSLTAVLEQHHHKKFEQITHIQGFHWISIPDFTVIAHPQILHVCIMASINWIKFEEIFMLQERMRWNII